MPPRSPYGRCPCHHGSGHPPDPCCRFGYGACNGTIDLAALIHAIMRQPGELPLLLRTALDATIGFAALHRCRQLLGPGLGLPSLKGREAELSSSIEIPSYGLDERYLERS